MTDRTFTLTVDDDGAVLRIKDPTPSDAAPAGRPIAAGDLVRVGPDATYVMHYGPSRSSAPEGHVSRVLRLDYDGDATLDGGFVVSPHHLTLVDDQPKEPPTPTSPPTPCRLSRGSTSTETAASGSSVPAPADGAWSSPCAPTRVSRRAAGGRPRTPPPRPSSPSAASVPPRPRRDVIALDRPARPGGGP